VIVLPDRAKHSLLARSQKTVQKPAHLPDQRQRPLIAEGRAMPKEEKNCMEGKDA